MSHPDFELMPDPLQLVGGPHQQPIGTLRAVIAGTEQLVNFPLEWSCSEKDFICEPAGATATVGAYRTVTATVTARDPATGRTARARVQVAVMDGGLGGRSM
jgi:hypothetical protein